MPKSALVAILVAANLFQVTIAAADDTKSDEGGYVCAQVMPQCDADGHVTGQMADKSSPCYYFYDNLCLEQKVQELIANSSSRSAAATRKLNAQIRRFCSRK